MNDNPEPLRLSGTITEREFIAASWWHLRTSSTFWSYTVVVLIMLLAMTAYQFAKVLRGDLDAIDAVVAPLVAGFICYGLLKFSARLRHEYRTGSFWNLPLDVEIDGSTMRVANELTAFSVALSRVHAVKESSRFLTICWSEETSFFIPKRFCASDGELNRLRELLRRPPNK